MKYTAHWPQRLTPDWREHDAPISLDEEPSLPQHVVAACLAQPEPRKQLGLRRVRVADVPEEGAGEGGGGAHAAGDGSSAAAVGVGLARRGFVIASSFDRLASAPPADRVLAKHSQTRVPSFSIV